jgi:hypothetical protein
MESGIPPSVLDAIQGYAPRTASDSYGDVTVKAMAQAMERVPKVEVARGPHVAEAGTPAPENTVQAALDVAWNSRVKTKSA